MPHRLRSTTGPGRGGRAWRALGLTERGLVGVFVRNRHDVLAGLVALLVLLALLVLVARSLLMPALSGQRLLYQACPGEVVPAGPLEVAQVVLGGEAAVDPGDHPARPPVSALGRETGAQASSALREQGLAGDHGLHFGANGPRWVSILWAESLP